MLTASAGEAEVEPGTAAASCQLDMQAPTPGQASRLQGRDRDPTRLAPQKQAWPQASHGRLCPERAQLWDVLSPGMAEGSDTGSNDTLSPGGAHDRGQASPQADPLERLCTW